MALSGIGRLTLKGDHLSSESICISSCEWRMRWIVQPYYWQNTLDLGLDFVDHGCRLTLKGGHLSHEYLHTASWAEGEVESMLYYQQNTLDLGLDIVRWKNWFKK